MIEDPTLMQWLAVVITSGTRYGGDGSMLSFISDFLSHITQLISH